MPIFIDNQGRSVVPSLQTLATASGAIREHNIHHLGPDQEKIARATLQRLGVESTRSVHRTAVYLAKDDTPGMVPGPSVMINLTRQAFEGCLKYLEPFTVIYCRNPNRDEERLQRWEAVKASIVEKLSDIEVVKLAVVRPAKNFVRLRPLERTNKFALEISSELMTRLSAELGNTWRIRRIIVDETVGSYTANSLGEIPHLTHLDIWEPVPFVNILNPHQHTLQELRIYLHPNIFQSVCDFSSFLTMMSFFPNLRLLFIYRSFPDRMELKMKTALQVLPATLRSLSFIGIVPLRITDLIEFLLQEVTTLSGERVPRQDFMEDFTVTGVTRMEMEAVYGHRDLTRRIKERIFCDIGPDYWSSALLNLSKKMSYGIGFALSPLIRRSLQMLTAVETPPLIMTRVILEVLHMNSVPNNSLGDMLSLLSLLLRPENFREADKRSIFPFALECIVARLENLKDKALNGRNLEPANELLHRLNLYQVEPSDRLGYLEVVVLLMKGPDRNSYLPPLLLKQLRRLQPDDLARFFGNMKEELCRVCLDFLTYDDFGYGAAAEAIADAIDLTFPTVDLFSFILQSAQDKDLLTGANAVLRRCTAGPHLTGTWFDSDTLDEENNFIRKYRSS